MQSAPAPTKSIREPASGRKNAPCRALAGRLAASAVALHDQVFIFGGYVVDSQGGETTVSDLNVFVPAQNRYYRGHDIPVPVDDAVVGLYRDRYIYRHRRMVNRQRTTPSATSRSTTPTIDTWMQATPIPGTPVFGHAGAIIGNTIVYVDGAYKNPERHRSQVPRVQRMLGGRSC